MSNWMMRETEYGAYAKAVSSALNDDEALTRCEQIKTEHPDWSPNNFSKYMHGPLDLSIARGWTKTTQWLTLHSNTAQAKTFQEKEQFHSNPNNSKEMKASIRAWLPKPNHPQGYEPEDARNKFSGIVHEGF